MNYSTDDAILLVKLELERAEAKFKPFNSMHEGVSTIREEFEELWDEVKRNDIEAALKEASHVAAMAIRFVKDISNNPNPLSRRE